MKKNYFLIIALFLMAISVFDSCKKDDEKVEPVTSATELNSKKATTAPVMDGTIDAAWDECDKLTNTAVVPGLAKDFANYTGESYDFTLRSMYDDANVYFLIEYADPKESLDRESWYFDNATKLWKQQNKKATSATDKFYEDKFAFLWPTATTGTAFTSQTCYATCHSVDAAAGYNTENKHYTNAEGEVVDMWHYKAVRTGPNNQTDDQKIVYIKPAAPDDTQKKDGGRASDEKTAGGYSDNKQTLNNGTADVSVPKYVIPGKTGYYWIEKADTENGTAKLVTAVDADGILTYDGGTIDPSQGGYEAATGTKRFPSIINDGTMVGSRGDLATYAKHTGSGWVIEIKRAKTTSDTVNDVQWDFTKEYMFGFAIFENAAIAHGIMPNLKLKFAK